MPRVLFFLQSIFSLWLLLDAMGRPGLQRYWYFIIMMPFGEWFYFFKYKIHDREFAWLKRLFLPLLEKPATVEELRFNLAETPSFHNKLALAQALYDKDHYEEAAKLFEDTLQQDSESLETLYGLGVTRLALEDDERAIEALRKLISLEPQHREYDGWAKLAQALWRTERVDECRSCMAELVRLAPRMQHRILYAYYLGQSGSHAGAQEQLVTALQEHEYGPRYLKRRNRALAKQARDMMEQLATSL